MKTAHDIILKPVITENSMAGIADKKYTFKVATDATKVEIAQAVETLFPGAKVAKVNTISVRGRFRRQGMHAGYTAASKKAIVTLTKDSKEIEFFNCLGDVDLGGIGSDLEGVLLIGDTSHGVLGDVGGENDILCELHHAYTSSSFLAASRLTISLSAFTTS